MRHIACSERNGLIEAPRLPYRFAPALSRSSSGLGHQPLTLGTGVRVPYGAPKIIKVISEINGLESRLQKMESNPGDDAYLQQSTKCASPSAPLEVTPFHLVQTR